MELPLRISLSCRQKIAQTVELIAIAPSLSPLSTLSRTKRALGAPSILKRTRAPTWCRFLCLHLMTHMWHYPCAELVNNLVRLARVSRTVEFAPFVVRLTRFTIRIYALKLTHNYCIINISQTRTNNIRAKISASKVNHPFICEIACKTGKTCEIHQPLGATTVLRLLFGWHTHTTYIQLY